MLDHTIHSLSGPDFLDAVADAEAAQDNHVNADTYRARAEQWRRTDKALEAAAQALLDIRRRRDDPPVPTSPYRHAITPTDVRS